MSSDDLPAEFRPVSPAAENGPSSYVAPDAAKRRGIEQEKAIREDADARWRAAEQRRLALINTLEDLVDEHGYLRVLAELERLQP